MKKNLIVVVLVLLCATTSYANIQQQSSKSKDQDVAESLSDCAYVIMQGRQKGITLVKVLDVIHHGNFSKSTVVVLDNIAADAFKTPIYTTKELQDLAAEVFKNKWYFWAVKRLQEKK
jgi:hypothetical protein